MRRVKTVLTWPPKLTSTVLFPLFEGQPISNKKNKWSSWITCIANVLCQCISASKAAFSSSTLNMIYVFLSHITQKNTLVMNREEVVVHCTLCQCSYASKCKQTKDHQRNWIFWGTNSTDLTWTPKMSRPDKWKTPQIIITMPGEEHKMPNPLIATRMFSKNHWLNKWNNLYKTEQATQV